jgi:hypothetical protein
LDWIPRRPTERTRQVGEGDTMEKVKQVENYSILTDSEMALLVTTDPDDLLQWEPDGQ